jgi:hypothetical protein
VSIRGEFFRLFDRAVPMQREKKRIDLPFDSSLNPSAFETESTSVSLDSGFRFADFRHLSANFMITYVYETLPRPGKPAKRFEIQQSIKDEPLKKHTTTGEPIRRCIVLGTDLFVREATIEKPEPRPVKRPKQNWDHAHDHYHHDHDH